jgi:exo-beta-1,3-glucanase (GH17 family)
MISITVQTVYIDGKRDKTVYDINVGEEAITGIDEETMDKLIEQLRKVRAS